MALPAAETSVVLSSLLEQQTLADPFDYLARLRATDPVHRLADNIYLLSRHADCALAKSQYVAPDRSKVGKLYPAAANRRIDALLTENLSMTNSPDHTRLRRVMGRDFTPRRMHELRAGTERWCERMLDEVEARLRDG